MRDCKGCPVRRYVGPDPRLGKLFNSSTKKVDVMFISPCPTLTESSYFDEIAGNILQKSIDCWGIKAYGTDLYKCRVPFHNSHDNLGASPGKHCMGLLLRELIEHAPKVVAIIGPYVLDALVKSRPLPNLNYAFELTTGWLDYPLKAVAFPHPSNPDRRVQHLWEVRGQLLLETLKSPQLVGQRL